VGGFVTAVATGSGYVGSQISEVASIWAQTGLAGFGREHELEADSLGAEYLVRGGYDPQAVIDVITVLKNQEDFNRLTTGSGGGYHGLFATHPRNDTRLQQAVAQVANLNDVQITQMDNTAFRSAIDGLIVGASSASRTRDERNRYYQTSLGYTLVFPDDWQVSETITTATAEDPTVGRLRVEVQRIQENVEPRVYLRDVLGITGLQKSEGLSQYRLIGHTGITTNPESGNPQRVAAIYFGPRVFVFRGDILDSSAVDEIDDKLLASIRTFRAIQRGEAGTGNEARIRFVQAGENFNFAALAQQSKIANYPEETLRLLNGYYPIGTPPAGSWIKLVE
ncbi:MAG: M48 family metalloprotease, partial [Gammaproteobacteria bacterium]